MVNDILTAVSLRLKGKFGYPVYGDEPISQGMKRPCFFICLTGAAETPLIAGRKWLEVPLDVVYFSQSKGVYSEMRQVGQELFDALRVLPLSDGSLIRGRGCRFEISDGVLHFYITFAMHLLPSEEDRDVSDILMENLDLQLGLD